MSSPNAKVLRPLSRGYSRETLVEADIAALKALPPAEFWRRAALSEEGAEGRPRPESLVYLAREFFRRGEVETGWRVMMFLQERAGRAVLRYLHKVAGLSRDQREEIANGVVCALFEAWRSDAPENEFWEVRYALCLKRLVIDAVKKHRRITDQEFVPTRRSEDEDGEADTLEQLPDTGQMSPEQAALAKAALDSLGEPLSRVFYLKYCEEWTEEEIARHIGKTSRTVRNYLRRAEELLRAWRDGMDAEA